MKYPSWHNFINPMTIVSWETPYQSATPWTNWNAKKKKLKRIPSAQMYPASTKIYINRSTKERKMKYVSKN